MFNDAIKGKGMEMNLPPLVVFSQRNVIQNRHKSSLDNYKYPLKRA